ncbi:MAG: hypothetical protein CENE_01445 [Candidatus Celerinatantimonas neptuna]|nr:MAG: hypothetical protein CENE_01445 [Candidatus Celerinatantimonas neptuna]
MLEHREKNELQREEIRRKRELAKAGMVASLGSVLITGMLDKKKAHVVSGVAFLGFAYWHTLLYAHSPNKKRLIESDE